MASNTHQVYLDFVDGVRQLGGILGPALAVQFEAPPGARPGGGQGVPNPTLDTVMDPRRLALSEEIASTERAMRKAADTLGSHTQALRQAVARWEGQEGSPAL